MTSIYDATGAQVPCTVIEAGPCVVTQVKTKKTDGYDSIQLAYDDKKEKNTTKAMRGHFAKAKTTPKHVVAEFTRFEEPKEFGEEVMSMCLLRENMLMLSARLREKVFRVV